MHVGTRAKIDYRIITKDAQVYRRPDHLIVISTIKIRKGKYSNLLAEESIIQLYQNSVSKILEHIEIKEYMNTEWQSMKQACMAYMADKA